MALNTFEQLQAFRGMLREGPYDRTSPLFKKALDWIRSFPSELGNEVREELRGLIRDAFLLSDEELRVELSGLAPAHPEQDDAHAKRLEDELWALIPTGGFFHRYCDYTRHSEAPLAYHLFSALTAIGAIVNRRVWFNMGYYRLFPNLGVIILGPSGIKKTSAANIAVSMLSEMEIIKIYSEKLTPEQLVEAMKDMPQGLIYAPEMAVFLGRQRYMEGIVPLITRFMDCPDVWSSETVMRGKKTLRDIAVSSLMCSTLEWFITNTSEDVVSGGFIARNIIVAQEVSPRLEPIPTPGDKNNRQGLMADMARVHAISGELTLSAKTESRYRSWYVEQKSRGEAMEHELLKTYYQRKPDHVKRVAICLHLAEHFDLCLCYECFERALAIMEWIEKFVPPILRKMFKSISGHEQDAVLNAIRASGGIIDHSLLVRKMQYKFNSTQLKGILISLKEAEQITERSDALMHVYAIKHQEEF